MSTKAANLAFVRRLRFAAAAFLVVLNHAALAQAPQDLEFRAKADGSMQRYVEWLPPGFDAATTNDVLLAFHGHGSDRWQFIRDARGSAVVRAMSRRGLG